MLQAWQTTFRTNEVGRRQLADKLAARGWRLCGQNPVSKICVGETDLCVAQLTARESAKGNGPVIVASGDSDYLAHDNVVLLRQNPKRRTEYCQYTQQEVISTLNKGKVAYCKTEADGAIAAHCQPLDMVVILDSDLLVYSTANTLYRPLRYNLRMMTVCQLRDKGHQ
ncbi:hypothetical protein DFQ27_005641 [Actinomortierella ambigua]|uniref:Uncharacterized protein n=1 Tax=Actinomortierella ambigua TaxID=1343610 RepID=A0A9P6Q052_9FUNG|nr:hypothetical protein DFQ27_005641 [Actinomortierella ambigua]